MASNPSEGVTALNVDGSVLVDEPGRTEGMTVARATEDALQVATIVRVGVGYSSAAVILLLGAFGGMGATLTRVDETKPEPMIRKLAEPLNGHKAVYNKSKEAARRLRQASPTPVSADARSHEAPTKEE